MKEGTCVIAAGTFFFFLVIQEINLVYNLTKANTNKYNATVI